ncbi:MAG: ABC transporter permease [Acidobacteriaceae bacterium]|nr:ABC transporter permease [Acidobacteriaceae bacterium]
MPVSIRIAVRALGRSLGFALLAIAILTLGIGATTAMFTITRTVLLKPLAYQDPDRLVTASFRVPAFSKQFSTIPINAQHYELWRDHSRTIQELAVLRPDSHILSGAGQAEQLKGLSVSPNFFHLLGSEPAIGRGFVKGEDVEGRNHIVVISYRLWRRAFSGRADAIGKELRLDGVPYQVVGIAAAGFPFPRGRELSELEQLPERTEYWTPLVFSKDDLASPEGNENYIAIARLKPGVTTQQAVADLTALEKVISQRYPEPIEFDPVVRRLQQTMARDVRLPLLLLMSAVAAVLLIVCINLMNLMMVRATSQRREWAIRLAVGAGVSELLRGALIESLLLSLAGCGLGSVLAWWILQLIRLKAPSGLPRVEELVLDPAALLFAVGISAASAILFGAWPAWRSARVDPQEALQSSSRSATQSRKAHQAGRVLVAAEVALSTVLLLAAGLLLRSFVTILNVNPGVSTEHVLTARVNLPPDKYHRDPDVVSFYRRLVEQTRALPGVRAAGLVSDLPLTGEDNNNPATAADRPIPPVTQWQMTNYRTASSGYFKAAGIPLEAGRVFEERDANIPEVVISSNLAARLWPNQNAVGRPLKIYGNGTLQKVIGVVGAVHAASLTQEPTMMIYFPHWRRADADMSLIVRSATDPEGLAAAVRRVIIKLEPQAAIPSIQSMRQVVADSVSEQRFQLILLAGFAVAALVLACLGIYGVLAFATSKRTSEIGIRMALGARPAQILHTIMRNGMAPVMVGIAIGLAASVGLARAIENLLFQVRATDPLMYAGTAFLLLIVAASACFLPARRAAALNPVEALRNE